MNSKVNWPFQYSNFLYNFVWFRLINVIIHFIPQSSVQRIFFWRDSSLFCWISGTWYFTTCANAIEFPLISLFQFGSNCLTTSFSYTEHLPLSCSIMRTKRGALIVFEGCDRVGKSTQVKLLAEDLRKKNMRIATFVFPGNNRRILVNV